MVYWIFFFYKGQLIHTKKDEKGYKVLVYRRKMKEISGELVDRKRKGMGCNQTQLRNSATIRRSHISHRAALAYGPPRFQQRPRIDPSSMFNVQHPLNTTYFLFLRYYNSYIYESASDQDISEGNIVYANSQCPGSKRVSSGPRQFESMLLLRE